jgi:hypothetical protein
MRKRVARCVVAAGAVALAAAAAGSAATGPSTIRITSVQVRQQTIDRGARGGGAGDVQMVQLRLYSPSVTERTIGRLCQGTYSLPRGQLVVAGTITTRLLYETAIVGGTGLYDNARGSLTVTATRFRPRHEVLLFRLTG